MTSVIVNVIDEAGNDVDAMATYTVDGGTAADCEGEGPELYCGGEEAGEFAITVDAVGYGPETIELTVEADECH
ncbi:MAG: hypothetical protein AAF497_23330, partial [Planctomycetota bacterium]